MGQIKISNKMIGFICLVCSLIIEGISLLQSADFWAGYADGPWGWGMIILGGTLDIGQVVFPLITVACFTNERWISTLLFSILTIASVVYSFNTSEGFNQNKTNAQIQQTIKESDSYKNQQKVLDTATDTQSLKDSIQQLKNTKASDEAKIRADYSVLIADARRLKFITTKGGVQDLTREMNTKITALQTTIDDKEKLLANQGSEANKAIEGFKEVGKDALPTRGIMGLAAKLDPKNPEEMAGKLNTWYNIFLIIAGLGFSLAAGMFLSKEQNKIPLPQQEPNPPQNNIDSKSKKGIIETILGSKKNPESKKQEIIANQENIISDMQPENIRDQTPQKIMDFNREDSQIHNIEVGKHKFIPKEDIKPKINKEEKEIITGKIEILKDNKIGFHPEIKEPDTKKYIKKTIKKKSSGKQLYRGISNENLKKYIELALEYSLNNNNQIPGYTKVKLLMEETEYKNIRGKLITDGFLKYNDGKKKNTIQGTFIINRKGLEEYYKSI